METINGNLKLNVPSDYQTIQDALDWLSGKYILNDVTVTIAVSGETHTHTSAIEIKHPQGNQIHIEGADPITTTVSSQQSTSGTAGDYSVILNLASVSGITTDHYCLIKNTTGIGNHYAHRGIWAITGVDSANTRITVTNTNRNAVFPTNTLTGGDITILKTVLSFTDCSGIVTDQTNLGLIDKCALVGNGYTGSSGLFATNTGSIKSGNCMGVSKFVYGLNCENNSSIASIGSAVCGNSVIGVVAAYGGYVNFVYGTSNGNGTHGIQAFVGGTISGSWGVSVGNNHSGVSAYHGSTVYSTYSVSWGNLNNGYYACGGNMNIQSSSAQENSIYGVECAHGSNIQATWASVTSNTSNDYLASQNSTICVQYYYGKTVTLTVASAISGLVVGDNVTAANGATGVVYGIGTSGLTLEVKYNGTDFTTDGLDKGTSYSAPPDATITGVGTVATSTFSPAINTEGNFGAYIVD